MKQSVSLPAAATLEARIAELEQGFGDPWAEDNPVGFAAILAADEAGEMLPAGERLLDEFGLNAEFVPERFGGRLRRIDQMMELMRALYRHDPCLGLGYGGSSMIASCVVWTADDPQHSSEVAGLLLNNRKLACSYYELDHGNDLAHIDFEAMPEGDQLRLRGSKQVTSNIQRADAAVIYARTATGAGSRSHSQILVNKSEIPEGQIRYLPRFPSVGMRGVQLGGVEFHDCCIPARRILGRPGQALELAIKAFQITRTTLPGMFLGILDTGLRLTLRYAKGRRLYGRSVAELPQARSVMVDAFVDLLICDALSTTVARAMHTIPGETCITAPAVKYLVPKIMIDAMNSLSGILGAHFYLRDGEHSVFQKFLRDVRPVGFGHVARVACQMTILPQLPRLARQAWGQAEPAPEATFRLDADLPPLAFEQLALSSGGKDGLSGSLLAARDRCRRMTGPFQEELTRLADRFATELTQLQSECAALKPQQLTVMAHPKHYDLTRRYALVIAASACLNLYQANRGQGGFVAEPVWALAALQRLDAQLDKRASALPPSLEGRLYDELAGRYEQAQSFDLACRSLPVWRHADTPSLVQQGS
ncbi:acyl-CoA dehydrogenase [Endothiovibrio diazotrophicus]